MGECFIHEFRVCPLSSCHHHQIIARLSFVNATVVHLHPDQFATQRKLCPVQPGHKPSFAIGLLCGNRFRSVCSPLSNATPIQQLSDEHCPMTPRA